MGHSSTMELLFEFHNELLLATAPTDDDELTKCKRKVRFAENTTSCDHLPHPLSRMDGDWDENCNTLWYSDEELRALKMEARNTLFRRDEMSEEQLRGLERYNYDRAQWKRQTNRYIMAANKESNGNAAFLSIVCQKCTMWARNIAIDQAARDAYLARLEDEPSPMPVPTPLLTRCGSVSKRPIECGDDAEGRRVRQRVQHVVVGR